MRNEIDVRDNILTVNGQIVPFAHTIRQVIEHPEGILVLLPPTAIRQGQNIYFVRYDGTTLWQVEPLGLFEDVGFTGFNSVEVSSDGQIEAESFGVHCRINTKTGKIYDRYADSRE